MNKNKNIVSWFANGNLVLQIFVGIILGIIVALVSKELALSFSILGELFVHALKAIAPILVFVLVSTAIATKKVGVETNIKPIIVLYIIGTFLSALIAVAASFSFPVDLVLTDSLQKAINPPDSIIEVLKNVAFNMVDNPIHALQEGNYMGILVWAIALGIAMHSSSDESKKIFNDVSNAVTKVVEFVIRLAPFGIFGLIANTVAKTGIEGLLTYLELITILVVTMLLIAFVLNPLIVFFKTKKNPYPLVLTCIKESGVTAFFTRSSAANIPVNLNLCKKLNLHEDTYSISIPLGATTNMAGAAVTITILTLATVHTLGISVDIGTAVLLCIISSLAACGTSGVAGGSILLIPLACSLFGIPADVASKVVGIGFTIGVIQDSLETALNSSTDVVFTAACHKED